MARPKMGFTLPFQRWMRSGLQPELERAFSRAEALSDSVWILIECEMYGRHLKKILTKNPGHDRGRSTYWSKWCELNGVTADQLIANGKEQGAGLGARSRRRGLRARDQKSSSEQFEIRNYSALRSLLLVLAGSDA